MKNIVLCYIVLFVNIVYSQHSFSVKNINEIDLETKEVGSSIEVNQFFNFSLTDGFMIHNLIDEEGNIEDSQFYKIIKKEKKNNVLIFITCESGVSGNTYNYLINEDEEMGTSLFQLIDENTMYQMEGKASKCKTFKQ